MYLQSVGRAKYMHKLLGFLICKQEFLLYLQIMPNNEIHKPSFPFPQYPTQTASQAYKITQQMNKPKQKAALKNSLI